DRIFKNYEEKKINKEDDKPLLSTPDEDIDWDSVSEDNIFDDYSQEDEFDEEENI
ncbi:MarR family transcriptional regulator, partial [Salmonella enterica]|nr:MarR family transcriptional regulator [Salmonella enterica]